MVVAHLYDRRCAATGERTLLVLEAAHIRPYAEAGPHDPRNGRLLRSDLHTLFDRGYLTVTPERKLEISRRIREEFENGREYYRLHGQPLRPPRNHGGYVANGRSSAPKPPTPGAGARPRVPRLARHPRVPRLTVLPRTGNQCAATGKMASVDSNAPGASNGEPAGSRAPRAGTTGEARDAEGARRERAEARRGRVVLRRTQLQEVEEDLTPLRGEEAVSLVYELTRESWALSGAPEPTYTRQEIPCRFVPHRRG